MKRFLIAFVAVLLAQPALAEELIATATDWATFAKAASATGFADANGVPKQTGPLTGAVGASWFYNAVGTVYEPTGATTTDAFGNTVPVMAALPGVWVRVRFNGLAPDLPTLIATWKSMGITIYQNLPLGPSVALCWSSDGSACGPSYIGDIGVIG